MNAKEKMEALLAGATLIHTPTRKGLSERRYRLTEDGDLETWTYADGWTIEKALWINAGNFHAERPDLPDCPAEKPSDLVRRMAEMHGDYAMMCMDMEAVGRMIEDVRKDVMDGDLFRAGLRLGMAYHVTTKGRRMPDQCFDLINEVKDLEERARTLPEDVIKENEGLLAPPGTFEWVLACIRLGTPAEKFRRRPWGECYHLTKKTANRWLDVGGYKDGGVETLSTYDLASNDWEEVE